MGKFRRFVLNFISDERGQGTVEYILILSATVAGALVFTRGLLKVLDPALDVATDFLKSLK